MLECGILRQAASSAQSGFHRSVLHPLQILSRSLHAIQMAGTAEVLSLVEPVANTNYSILVPNQKGLDGVLALLSGNSPPPITEIAVFTSATDGFGKANTNTTTSESLARLAPVVRSALAAGLKVRGYVSVVITCPYSGRVDPRRVRDVSRELLQMGCYEVSLGDTTGTGTPASVRAVLEEVAKDIDVNLLAGHVSRCRWQASRKIVNSLTRCSSMIPTGRHSPTFRPLSILA